VCKVQCGVPLLLQAFPCAFHRLFLARLRWRSHASDCRLGLCRCCCCVAAAATAAQHVLAAVAAFAVNVYEHCRTKVSKHALQKANLSQCEHATLTFAALVVCRAGGRFQSSKQPMAPAHAFEAALAQQGSCRSLQRCVCSICAPGRATTAAESCDSSIATSGLLL
jgi:hypothetical protein